MIPIRFSSEPYSILRGEVDRLFDEFLSPNASRRFAAGRPQEFRRNAFPALNLWETTEAYMLEAECPGLDIEDLELSITGNQLTLSGERKVKEGEDLRVHRRERGHGSFSRLLSLPSDVDSTKVEAALKNGVLTITLPKAESAKPRKIEVKA